LRCRYGIGQKIGDLFDRVFWTEVLRGVGHAAIWR
jgi:hypothetical protein